MQYTGYKSKKNGWYRKRSGGWIGSSMNTTFRKRASRGLKKYGFFGI